MLGSDGFATAESWLKLCFYVQFCRKSSGSSSLFLRSAQGDLPGIVNPGVTMPGYSLEAGIKQPPKPDDSQTLGSVEVHRWRNSFLALRVCVGFWL